MPYYTEIASRQVNSHPLQDEILRGHLVHLLLYFISTPPAHVFTAKDSNESLQTLHGIFEAGCRLPGCGSSTPKLVLTNADVELI